MKHLRLCISHPMLFDFRLRPLEEIHPWGNPPDLSLSWFGFTDGFYRLKVGPEFLLNYSDEFIAYGSEQYPNVYSGPFIDYYVVRLWEDVLDMLPDILQPLPIELSNFFKGSKTAWFEWENYAGNWVDHQSDEDEAMDVFELAVWWQRARHLSSAYLQNAPNIWMWSMGDDVIVSWNNTDIRHEGVRVWSAGQGHYCLSRSHFLNEVRAFHNRLMSQMGERVEDVCHHWSRSEIYVDVDRLRYEQQDRQTWLDHALKRSHSTSLSDAMSAINSVLAFST